MRSSAVAFVLALAACASGPDTAIKYPDQVSLLEAQTVALVKPLDPIMSMLEGVNVKSFCTGVWVTDKLVLTAKHCTEVPGFGVVTKEEALDGVRVRSQIEPHKVKVVGVDGAHDIALLEVEDPPPHPIAKVSDHVSKGEPVTAVGHSMGLWWSVSTGIVSAVREIDDGFVTCTVVQTTAPTSPGNSGGGLFNAKGELVGIAHATLAKGQNLNFFIHPQYVSAFLPR